MTSGVVLGMGDYVNASIHRLSVIDADKFVIRLVPRHLYSIYLDNKSKGKDTPVAIAWGGVHPAFLLASASSPPFGGVSELDVAAKLLDYKVVQLDNGVIAPKRGGGIDGGIYFKGWRGGGGGAVR